MAVLNKIRQRSLFLILIIALALFSFVLADLFQNSDALIAKSQNIVATINGKDITREEFLQKVEVAQQQSGATATSSQVMNRVWDQEVRQAVMETQFEKLGITVEKDQMRDLLKTALASSPEFLNEAGLFDENKLNEYIINLKETSPAGYESWINYEKSLAANALQQNYYNMVKAGLTGTLAEGELQHKLEGNKVDVQYVQVPFSSVIDSTVQVTTSDIKSYISKNEKQYKVEESRDIRYIEFKEMATVEDENAIKAEVESLLNDKEEYNQAAKASETVIGFKNTTDNEGFVNSHSDIKFEDRFVFKSGLPTVAADSIFDLNVGGIYGAYKDNGYYKITKVIDVTKQPDSVQARHILIPFIGSRSATETALPKEEAKRQADSLLAIFKSNKSKFAAIAEELSADTGSAQKGGDLGYFTSGRMVPEFNDFCFQQSKGDIGVVETVFGFHIIDIQDQKNIQRAIKVATIARKIEPSEATISKVFRDASNFEIAVTEKDFDEVANENNYSARPVNGIKVLDENIPGIGNQRPIVRWAFEEDVKVGKVKRFNVSGGYAIVQLVAKHEAGLMSVEEAKATAIPAIRKEKKAEIIRDRISATTLEDLAKAEKTSVRSASAINMKNPTLSGAGREPLVVGAAFALKEGETSNLIDGNNGVYMIKVTKIEPAVVLDNYQSYANQVEAQKSNVVSSKLYNALKEAADIEDNRAKSQVQ
ncbi:peptidylprolyl isomerase [Pseudalgibacter alginicilyticus]|uniref:Periplasmic chaperone PpiD n=1 Tax=Pseudalgibacter alginicilyticus TaxID=1736674 RepID=A0A0P0D2L3_9FLAO|nr:peptidylprolyl isomerase [Pseudalgibacter alginicilyticus]ALJ05176.1 peptidylprolyl isomerase [Pseudalgibacter alginicilyticus]